MTAWAAQPAPRICSTIGILEDRSHRVATTMMSGAWSAFSRSRARTWSPAAGFRPGEALGKDLAECLAGISVDQDQPPGLEPAVIRGPSGRLEHGVNRLLEGGGWV